MSQDLKNFLVIGVSSRALFDLTFENQIFEKEGLEKYKAYQIKYEDQILNPGAGFPLVKSILALNEKIPSKRYAEVIILSKNSSETSLRIWKSIEHYKLEITRGVFSSGAPLAPYIDAFNCDLFLSFDANDVQEAINSGTAAALIFHHPPKLDREVEQIRVAFDGDAVLFSNESEKIYKEHGLEAFIEHEKKNARKPLPDGPFAKLLRMLHFVQKQYKDTKQKQPIRTALITARNAPAHERVIRTLKIWGVDIDEVFFMGGLSKTKILEAFKAHIFFDDQLVYCDPASRIVPTGKVPSQTNKIM